MNETGTTEPTATPGMPTPPPPAPTPQRRLTRRTEQRMLAGVAGGVADFVGLDPVIVRLLFVVLAFFGGTGFVLYLAGWALIPSRSGGPAMAQKAIDSIADGPSWLGVALLIVAALILASQITLWSPAVTWALILIGVGTYLFRKDQPRPAPPQPSGGDLPPPPEGGISADAWDPPGGPIAPSDDVGVAPESGRPAAAGPGQPDAPPPAPPGGHGAYPAAPWQAPPPRERAPRSILGRLTTALTLVALGVAALLDSAGVVFMSPSRYIALALAGVGLGLVVGAWRGRSRGLLALGLALLLLLPAVNVLERVQQVARQGGIGDHYWYVSSAAELRDEYHVGLGEAVLDLRELADQPGDERVRMAVGVGRLQVLAPPGWDVNANVTIDAGEMSVLGTRAAGTGISREVNVRGDGAGGTLTLDLQTGIGSVTVGQAYLIDESYEYDREGEGLLDEPFDEEEL